METIKTELSDPWVSAVRSADNLCPCNLSTPDKWRWKAAHLRSMLAKQAEAAPVGAVERGIAQKDADLYGVGYLVDGKRVAPEWVTIIRPAIAQHAASVEAKPAVPLIVWEGAMPESNGKTNYTAVLMRRGAKWLDGMTDGHTIAVSEYPGRVRYEADCVRWLIGDLADRPDILEYDTDKHSGYTAPPAPHVERAGPYTFPIGEDGEYEIRDPTGRKVGEVLYYGDAWFINNALRRPEQTPHVERDAARLDFMDRMSFIGAWPYSGQFQVIWHDDILDRRVTNGKNVREAIDAAMAAQQGGA